MWQLIVLQEFIPFVYVKYIKIQNYYLQQYFVKMTLKNLFQNLWYRKPGPCVTFVRQMPKYEWDWNLLDLFYECNFNCDDTVNFKRVDSEEIGISLVNCTLDEFVKKTCCKFDNFRAHHFIPNPSYICQVLKRIYQQMMQLFFLVLQKAIVT